MTNQWKIIVRKKLKIEENIIKYEGYISSKN